MPLQDNVKEKISIEIIRTLVGRFGTFPDDANANRNAPFHEAFLKAFSNKLGKDNINPQILISLSSWLHGLNTTLGQQFFEKVAHILSGGEKRAFTNEKISRKQKSAISDIITNLKNSEREPNMIEEDKQIESCMGPADIAATNFSADVFIQDDSIVAIELKTVNPNSGVLKEEKHKILEAKAVLRRLYPDKKVS
ncbi:MAG: TdeIII family type II restriction endonuclease, partial [Syntrophorhabdus sp.]